MSHISEVAATVIFSLAVFHTFLAGRILAYSQKCAKNSIQQTVLHTLGEVELVFGIWALVFCLYLVLTEGFRVTNDFVNTLHFHDAIFVVVAMTLSSTRPVMSFANRLILVISKLLPFDKNTSFLLSTLVVGSLIGSLITEPSAMTITALILKEHFFDQGPSPRLKYLVLGTLFVLISVGGTLTHFAAPPVLMVATKWNWDFQFMLTHFGWRAVLIAVVASAFVVVMFQKEIKKMDMKLVAKKKVTTPTKFREALLVGAFLAGLVVLGGPQRWWLEPVITRLTELDLFFGALGLTAILDNAALTYLGAQVDTLGESAKYFLVAGAVAGGGLTVIANAPNPAGYGILQSSFGKNGIEPLKLFAGALIPTLIAVIGFLIF